MMDKQTLLRNFISDAEANIKLAKEKLTALTEAQLNWQPAPKSWSVAQAIEHINITNRHWLEQFNKAIGQGAKAVNTDSLKHSFFGSFIYKNLLNPAKKFKTSAKHNPPSPLNGKKVVDEFFELQKQWTALYEKVRDLDLEKKYVSPLGTWMKWKLGEAIPINNTHTMRHLRQAVRVITEKGFPK